MHYYKFNIGDYASHTQHLDPIEDIAYRRMLDWVYLHESPLPDSPEQIGRLIRMRTHSECIAVVLREFFVLTDHGWMQEKADSEIQAYNEKSTKAKASAMARWAKKPNKQDANALQPESERNANHKPLTTNKETLNNNHNILIENEFERFWLAGMTKQSKQKSKQAFVKQFKEAKKTAKDITETTFTDYLVADIQKRLAADVFGFDKMHPTTYLNQQRWHDDIVENKKPSGSSFDKSMSALLDIELGNEQGLLS